LDLRLLERSKWLLLKLQTFNDDLVIWGIYDDGVLAGLDFGELKSVRMIDRTGLRRRARKLHTRARGVPEDLSSDADSGAGTGDAKINGVLTRFEQKLPGLARAR